jgi:arylsulfatase A-like enzyme
MLVNTTDLYATIADIAGVEVSRMHDSYSFTQSFTQQDSGERAYAYSEVGDSRSAGYTIRDARYKLIVLESGSEKMYDLQADPYENTNLLNRDLSDQEMQSKQELEEYIGQIQN